MAPGPPPTSYAYGCYYGHAYISESVAQFTFTPEVMMGKQGIIRASLDKHHNHPSHKIIIITGQRNMPWKPSQGTECYPEPPLRAEMLPRIHLIYTSHTNTRLVLIWDYHRNYLAKNTRDSSVNLDLVSGCVFIRLFSDWIWVLNVKMMQMWGMVIKYHLRVWVCVWRSERVIPICSMSVIQIAKQSKVLIQFTMNKCIFMTYCPIAYAPGSKNLYKDV